MRFAIAAASVLALAGAAAADTIKVPQDQPTIQAGVSAAATGDTVSVSKGVYFENVVVSTAGIRIVGKGAILDGNIAGVDGDCLTINAEDVFVQGITFRNGDSGIVLAANGAVITKCTFQAAGNDGVTGTAGTTSITSCKFLFPSNEAVDLNGTGNLVSKCTVTRGGSYGVRITGDGGRVESCTFTWLADNSAVLVTGNNAVLLKNKASNGDADCFRADGTGALVDGNKGDRNDGRLVQVNGNGAIVQKNSGTYCRGGVFVNGDAAQVLSNKLSNIVATSAIQVDGDGFTVTGNTVSATWDEAPGISANSATVAGGGLIEGNKVSDAGGYGFDMDVITGVTLRNNSATRCGTDDRGGFNISGDDNTLEGLQVTDAEGPGFVVDGDGNDFVSCTVKKAGTDGFRVDGGTGNTFDKCSATSCGGEGFDNGGIGTVLGNSTFSKNRIDVANDVTGGATIPGGLGTVKFTTGGDATQPEVD